MSYIQVNNLYPPQQLSLITKTINKSLKNMLPKLCV